MKNNKKGQYGIDIVRSVIIMLFILALILVSIFAGASAIKNSTILPTLSGSIINETITPDDEGTALSVNSYSGISCSITQILNDSQVINSGNYTVLSPCKIANLTSEFVDRAWNVTYSYTYYSTEKADTESVLNNITSAGTSFFSNTGTFISILVVVVIFIFLGLMIGAITYFVAKKGKRESGI